MPGEARAGERVLAGGRSSAPWGVGAGSEVGPPRHLLAQCRVTHQGAARAARPDAVLLARRLHGYSTRWGSGCGRLLRR